MNRRELLAGILAAGFAPAIGHAGILMPVRSIALPSRAVLRGTIIMPAYVRTWPGAMWVVTNRGQGDILIEGAGEPTILKPRESFIWPSQDADF